MDLGKGRCKLKEDGDKEGKGTKKVDYRRDGPGDRKDKEIRIGLRDKWMEIIDG